MKASQLQKNTDRKPSSDIPQFQLGNIRSRDAFRPIARERKDLMDSILVFENGKIEDLSWKKRPARFSGQVVTNPWCGLAVIFCGFISRNFLWCSRFYGKDCNY